MKLKRWMFTGLMALAISITGIAATGCGSSESGATQYTCSMHPEVVQSSPGKCPKCGMDLIVKK